MAEKMTRARVAFALLCGLAVCCSVMYITADGESEHALAEQKLSASSKSVASLDFQKVKKIYTNTPDGRMRMTAYLNNVEKEIAAEEAARKRDVASVRAQMARNFAFNKAARKKMNKFLLAKMAANAKKAKKDLDDAMRRTQAQFAAAATLANQRNAANIARSKKIRATVARNKAEAAKNLHIQVVAQQRAMAADRAHADALLQTTTARMAASLNAEKALRDAQFAKTVKDIAAAKAEAKARVAAARTEFKVGIRKLKATVDRQVAKTNNRITQLSNVVEKNKVAQAKVNANVAAETKRMIALGNKRYSQHLKNDAELRKLINANKAATDKRLDEMAAHYAMELNKVRKTMKKNRAHATHMLTKETSKLYAAIAKGEKAQALTNAALSSQTRQARMDITDALHSAKQDFGKRLGALHSTVVKNDKKFEKKMDKLTGIVRANAVKSAKGRAMLANVMKANKEEMKAAVSM